jgi:hypothetical protein
MPKRIFFVIVLVSAFLAANGTAPAQQQPQDKLQAIAPAQAPAMDSRAMGALKKMSDTLSKAKTVRFQARSIVPVKGPGGIWISLYGTSRVIKEGPGKLFAETRGDFFPYDFYFDGKKMTSYSPSKNIYAEKNMPGTIDSVIEDAYRQEGRSFPYADILIEEPYNVLIKDLVRAVYVGRSTIGGVETSHLAFFNKMVEWQMWVGVKDDLPRLVFATYLDDVREPSYAVEFSDWKLNDPVPENTFTFLNKTKAAKVEFRGPGALENKELQGAK